MCSVTAPAFGQVQEEGTQLFFGVCTAQQEHLLLRGNQLVGGFSEQPLLALTR